ncbi:MAG: hypothetical protein QXQ45_02385 [Candidatus Hadarchaeales archaeon]
MKYFPRYRIYSILIWLTPALLCYYLLKLTSLHWLLKVFLFLVLYPIFFLGLVFLFFKIGKLWNARQRKKQLEKQLVTSSGP